MRNIQSTSTVWVIIPGYNEEKYLAEVLRKVLHITRNVIFVDDGSSDKTFSIAKQHLQHVLRHEVNLGKGAALLTGCEYAFQHLNASAVIFMDADDQHDPNEIPKFIESLSKKNDVVFGVRKFSSATMPFARFLGNKIASACLIALYGSYIPDIPSGYKALTKKGYEMINWKSTGYEVETEIAAKVAQLKIPFSIIEIETIYHDTDKGMNGIEALKILKCLIQWKFDL